MHLHHLQGGLLSFYFSKVVKIIKVSNSIKTENENIYAIVTVNVTVDTAHNVL